MEASDPSATNNIATSSLQPGSIAEISKRLALWARRDPKGLVRVEYSSEFARQRVVQQLKSVLAKHEITVHEITLPAYQYSESLVLNLMQQLHQVAQEYPNSVVSIAGFSTAFNSREPLPDALRVVNFNRDKYVELPLKQIWWMTPNLMQTVIHAMPDLNSWFSQRLQLTEAVIDTSTDSQILLTDSSTTNIDDARHRAHRLIQQFHTAKQAGASDSDLLTTYLLPALEALADANAQKDLRDITGQFEGLLGSLKLAAPNNTFAHSLDRLARTYEKQGRYGEAEPMYRQALAIRETLLKADDPAIATSLNNLASLYRVMRRYSEAESLYQRSLAIREQHLGTDHPDVAQSLNNLAVLYKVMRRYSKAESLYQRSLAIREQHLGTNHPDVATTLNNLGLLYDSMGRYSEAESLYARALAIDEKVYGANHPDVATDLDNLGLLYDSMRRYSEAEPLYARALAIREQQLGTDHPHVATSLNNLAGLYASMGRYSEAEPLYARALAIDEKVYGTDHPEVATDLNNLALLYRAVGRYSKAETFYLRAIEIDAKTLPKEHPYIESGQNNFRLMVQAALEEGKANQLSDHPTTQAVLRQLREGTPSA
ncbi:MAG: tetratricopeptide repeat protein [Cyanobacteria bacterium J06638_20]